MRNKRSVVESACLLVIMVLGMAAPTAAQVHRVAELNTEHIRALDRARTVVILPGGILEQHGPYLPSYTDGYRNERLAQALAEAVAGRPGWAALVFPSIPLGTGGANEIGRKYVFPGTYAIRSTTLRSLFMDLAGELGEQGFRWIFVVHGHGAPNHNRMIDQAGDYFHDTYGGWMVHLRGLLPVATAGDNALDTAARQEDGFSVHAGAAETSEMLFLRPGLVSTSLREAEIRAGADWSALVRIARDSSWPGYFGSPRLATAAQGARINRAATDAALAYALKILDGMDPRDIPRLGDVAHDSPENVAIDADALRREMEILRKQEEWLTRKKSR
jgi:creatinine amidohydrolase/Fe(II)-dependent formamide hydrolase-like protein